MTSQKIVVVESEKSPKVCSSNWKEDVILGKNVTVLEKSKKTVLNRITVDQKILLRRFQTRLNRSKMSYARSTGNVELQQRLREKTTFVLNTNIGHNDTLHRIWTRGRRTYRKRVDADPLLNRRKIGAFTCIEDDDVPKEDPSVTSDRSGGIPESRLTAVNLRPNTVITLGKTPLPAASPTRRPHTTLAAQRSDVIPTITVQTPGGTQDTDPERLLDNKRRPQTAKAFVQDSKRTDPSDSKRADPSESKRTDPSDSKRTDPSDSKRADPSDCGIGGGRKRRPSTADGLLQTINNYLVAATDTTSQTKSVPRNNDASRKSVPKTAAPSGGGVGIGSVFETDEFQISLVDFQRFLVHSANYEARVKRYGSSVDTLKLDKSRDTDYYTARLGADSARVAEQLPSRLSRDVVMAASAGDVRRATGNLQVRSLTTKSLDL